MKKFTNREQLPEELKILVDRHYYEADYKGCDGTAIEEIRSLGYIVNTDKYYQILWIGVNETAEEIYRGLKYSTQFINMNWRIKVNAKGLNLAVGVSGLINLIGIDLTNRLFDRTAKGMGDKLVCRLRRGIKVTFYTK